MRAVPVPKYPSGIGLTLRSSSSSSPQPPAAVLFPTTSDLSNRGRAEAGRAAPLLTSQNLSCCLFGYLLLQFSFVRAQQRGESLAFPGLRLARGELNGGLGYVSSLSGLLTGLPPFMTTGSLVVLLEGGPPASLGTASPTSCNEGSRYIATSGGRKRRTGKWEEGEERKEGERLKKVYRRRSGKRGE